MHDPQNDPDEYLTDVRRVTTVDGIELIVAVDQDGVEVVFEVDVDWRTL